VTTLATTGTYTIIISEGSSFSEQTGPYIFEVQQVFPPTGSPISLNTTVAGTIDNVADVDLYTFQGTAEQGVILAVGEEPGGTTFFRPELRKPDGAFQTSTCDNRVTTLATTGTYTIIISEGSSFSEQTGPYIFEVTTF